MKKIKTMQIESKIITDKKGNPIMNVLNVVCMLETAPIFTSLIKYDNWTQKLYFKDGDTWVDFRDHHFIALQCLFQEKVDAFQKLPIKMVTDAVILYAQKHTTDLAIDYVRSLTWDKKDRIKDFMHIVYGTNDDNYHHVVGENFMKGIVARIIQPGVKHDYVLVIEGDQGIGKSTSLNVLSGELGHLETTENPDNKDFLLTMRGKLIVEFTEGVIMNKKDAASLKGFVSKQVDTFREPYGRIEADHPRRGVFAMTTNSEEYLKDDTGNRRFIPIYANKCDIEWIRENRDMLFAEALHRYEILKETFFEYPQEDLLALHREKIIKSPHFDRIKDWCLDPQGDNLPDRLNCNGGFTAEDIWINCLHGSASLYHIGKAMEIAGTLKEIGFEKRRKQVGNYQKNRWFRIDEIESKNEQIDSELEKIEF